MSARFLLVDLESIQPLPREIETWLTDTGSAWVFHGPHQLKMLPRYTDIGERVTIVPISRPGKNSLDFHLVFYLGYLTARNPNAKFAVLSRDTGYDPAIAHAQTLAFDLLRIERLGHGDTAAVQPAKAVKKGVPKKAAAKPPVAPKKKAVPAKKALVAVKKVAAKKVTAQSKTEATVPAKQAVSAKAAKSSARTVGAIYRDVLQGLREQASTQPKSRQALERHVQTQFGPEPAPDKVRALVDRLFTVEAVRQEGTRLVYFPNDSAAVKAAPAAIASLAKSAQR